MKTQKNFQGLFSFIWHFLQIYKSKLIGMVIVSVILAFDFSIRPYMIKLIIDGVVQYKQGLPDLFSLIILPILGFLLSGIVLAMAFRFYDVIRLSMLPQLQADVMNYMFNYVQFHSYSFFQETMSGAIAAQINEMTVGIKELMKLFIDKFFAHFLALFIASATLLTVHPFFAVVILLWAIFFLTYSVILSKKSDLLAQDLSQAQNVVTGKIVDSLTNIMTVRLFTQFQQETSRLCEALNFQVCQDKKLEWCMFKTRTIQSISVHLMMGILLTGLIYGKYYGMITAGDFAFIISLSLAISEIVWKISDDCVTLSESAGRCKQALRLINLPHAITDDNHAQVLHVSRGEIVFSNACFSFYEKQKIFSKLSLKIEVQQKVGIIGSSGVGKTTFLNLITRTFDINSGAIFIDGQDIRQVTQQSLCNAISFIPQDVLLFHRTIKENIAGSAVNVSEQEIILAAKKACIHDFIMKLSDGYNTIVGERGIKLSGGQRQRIAIARAYFKNAPILILDEATSLLDSATEKLIQESLFDLMHNKTVIAVAHRLSTLRMMDRILVFTEQGIVEDGEHHQLLAAGGLYKNLWDRQVAGFL